MKPGIVHGLTNEEYHSIPALNASGLTTLSISPLHYWAKYVDPSREKREPSAAQELGTLIHTLILEPAEFSKRFIVLPESAPKYPTAAQWAAKKPSDESIGAMQWWRQFEQANIGVTLIKPKEYEAATRIAERVRNSPAAGAIFEKGIAESSIFWNDAETGVLCKCRPDWIVPELGLMVDLKSSRDARPSAFSRAAANYGYDIQAAWYPEGYRAHFGNDLDVFVFAVVESSAPYAPAFFTPTVEMVSRAREKISVLKRTYAKCLATNTWPGFADTIVPLDIPAWATRDATSDHLEPEEY